MTFADRIRLRCACFWEVEPEHANLIDKWNGIQFARQHDVPVPEVYWHGLSPYDIPFDELPNSFVIKGSRGYNAERVFIVDDGEHRSGNPLTLPQIQTKLDTERRSDEETFLVQEFVSTDGTDNIPLEYQFHMFGAHIGAIQLVNENIASHRFYHANWTPFEFRVATYRRDDDLRERPPQFAELCGYAVRLGSAYERYVRVDFLQSQTGFLFSELCATPMGGECFTPESDEYFGQLWTQTFDDLL